MLNFLDQNLAKFAREFPFPEVELELRAQVELKYLALLSQLEVLLVLEFMKICP